MSEATVFTYFAGKRELCIQVITDWYSEISEELERDVPQLQGVHAKLAHVVRAHLVTLLADGSGMCALVLSEGRAAEPELARVIADWVSPNASAAALTDWLRTTATKALMSSIFISS